jgi:hypothetical protein
MGEMYAHGMIWPIMVLVLWSLVMWVWLYAMRIPAMQKAKINPQEAVLKRELALPPRAMWPADNYNHLMEQPTIFYAAAFATHLSGNADPINIGLAWLYVALRIVHSLIQATVNIVTIRFMVFTVSSIVLTALALRVTAQLCGYTIIETP